MIPPSLALAARKVFSVAHNPIGRGRGDGNGPIYELAGTLMLNNSLQILDLTSCDINGYGANARGFDKHLERVVRKDPLGNDPLAPSRHAP